MELERWRRSEAARGSGRRSPTRIGDEGADDRAPSNRAFPSWWNANPKVGSAKDHALIALLPRLFV